MSQAPEKYRYIFRYVFGLMGLIAVAAAAVVVSFYFVQKADREAHDRVTFYHIESTLLAERLRRENLSLLRLLGFDIPEISEIARSAGQRSRQGPDARGILQTMASGIRDLRALDREHGDGEYDATLDRVEDRFRVVADRILADATAASSRRAILSFDLAVEQLYRQHSITAEVTRPNVGSVVSNMTPYLLIVAAILFAAGGVSVVAMRLLRKSIVRQTEAEHSLAESVERMHHLEKLESLGRLVGGVSHDFNNLLTAILGQTGLLLDRPGDERTRYGLMQIQEAGQQAAALTRQLLNFSRPQPAETLVIDVNDLIRNIEAILIRVIGEDIELNVDYGDDLHPVEVDPGQLQQVILNLVVNARDAMPDGGQLSIVTRATDDGEYTRITVADSGTGMDKEILEHIFEPYFTTKAMGRGTGLGLSTVYGVINAAGGHIDVSSSPGQGARFDACFPISAKPVSRTASEAPSGMDLVGDETVLVVEDDDKIRALLRDGLELLGYRVLLASNASEGLDICRNGSEPIDVILSDVIMPGMNGAEFVKEAIKTQPQVTPVLMSGYTDDVLLRTDIEEMGVPLLYKPFEVAEVAALIREQRSHDLASLKGRQGRAG
ncbi:MAG: ATP-binding protein [Woeseiaceae bacterium]|nr:ATP-binding protein [Woeseiaceae bacterium]